MKVNVLGTTYTLEEHTLEEDKRLYNKDGYFDYTTNECVVIKEIPKDREYPDEFNEVGDFEKYKSKVKRHELIHAFLKESGVGDTYWGSSEDMVNWLAEQFPKMASAFLKANCLDADGNYENQKENYENQKECEIPNPYDVSMAYFYHGEQVISPEEFNKRISDILLNKNLIPNSKHDEVEDLICETLKSIGYHEGIEKFEGWMEWMACMEYMTC